MTNRKTIPVYFNVDLGVQVDSKNIPVGSNFYPEIFFKEYPVMLLTFCKGTAQGSIVPYTGFPADMSFTAAVDNDFDHTSELMLKSRNSVDVNIAGDWASASIPAGRLSIRMNANTIGFQTKIGTAEALSAYFELQGFVVTDIEGTPTVVLASIIRFPVVVRNTIDDSEGSTPLPTDPLSGYYPYWTVDALLAGKAPLHHSNINHTDLSLDAAATGTDFIYNAGRVQVGNAVYDVGAGTLALTASGNHYVEVSQSGVVSDNTVGFSRGSLPLYQVYSDGAVLTSYDRRAWMHLSPTKNIGELDNVSKLLFEEGSNLTAATGTVTVTGAVHSLIPETGLSDDITAINMSAGTLSLLLPGSSSYSLTLKAGTYLQTPDGADYIIPKTGVLVYRHGSVTEVLTETLTKSVLKDYFDGVYIPAPATPSQGSTLYYNGSAWVSLPPGAAGTFLRTNGASANPDWFAAVTGTGFPSATAGDLLYYNGSAWVTVPAGADGRVLTTHGASASPDWTAVTASGSLPVGTRGELLYHDGSDWVVLPVGTPGQVLQTEGATANPNWATITRHGGYDTINIPAGTFIPATANGPRYARTVSATQLINQDVYWFAGTAATADQEAWCGLEMPDTWDKGPVRAFAHWLSPSTGVVGQQAKFILSARAFNPGESLDQAMGTAVTATDSVTAADRKQGVLFGAALTAAGTPQEHSLMVFKLQRPYNVGCPDEIGFLGLSLQFQESTDNPTAWT